MGQKINPTAFRLGGIKKWSSRWFSAKNYRAYLEEDWHVRNYIEEKLAKASVESIVIVRSGNSISITILSARPGIIIGRGGKGLEELQKGVLKVLRRLYQRRGGASPLSVKLDVEEIRHPDSYARLVAKSITEQLEKRLPFRRVMKQTMEKVMQQRGVEGVKISLAGRLGGAEIARVEQAHRGKIPLGTLRANIDYSQVNARTTYGVIGVKVWIYKGEVFADEKEA